MSAISRRLSAAVLPLILALASAIACQIASTPPDPAASTTLGAFLGPLVLITLLLPALALSTDLLPTRLLILSATLLPFWIVWIYIALRFGSSTHPLQYTRISECLACCTILTAYAIALVGLAAILRRTRLPALASAAIATLSGLAWLTWPIYMSRTWQGSGSADRIAPFIALHPGFAINGQLFRQFGLWTEQSIAYHLTDLGQHVLFTLPRNIWPCVLAHGLLGAGFFALSVLRRPAPILAENRQPPATTPPPAPSPPPAS